jgi:large subunit ribosomal protein L3
MVCSFFETASFGRGFYIRKQGVLNASFLNKLKDYMKFILARKGRMTQIFQEDGQVKAGTVLTASPITVTQVKTADVDGYTAVQVGFGAQKAERVNKAQRATKAFQVLKEFRAENASELGDLAIGAEINLDTFTVGDSIQVVGTSKGHGFAGVVKRHGFHGGRRSHGQKHSEREPGSIGGGGRAGGRVAKGMRMGGRMGTDRITVKNLRVLHIDTVKGQIIVSGAVPGAPGSLVEITSTSTPSKS